MKNPWHDDYDATEDFWKVLEALKAKFGDKVTDSTWHNDACPSVTVEPLPERYVRVWIDYRDPELSEIGTAGDADYTQFGVTADEFSVNQTETHLTHIDNAIMVAIAEVIKIQGETK